MTWAVRISQAGILRTLCARPWSVLLVVNCEIEYLPLIKALKCGKRDLWAPSPICERRDALSNLPSLESRSHKHNFWKIKNEIAEREKNKADIKKKTLDAEHFTALINRNTAILNYNRVARAGNTITIPPLPNLELYAILPSEFTLGQIDMNQTRT